MCAFSDFGFARFRFSNARSKPMFPPKKKPQTITNGQLTQDVEQLKEAVSADGGGVSTRPATPSEAEKADELAAQNTVLMRGLREAEADAERARGKAAELVCTPQKPNFFLISTQLLTITKSRVIL